MSLIQSASSTRKRRIVEVIVLVPLLACANLLLGPVLRTQAQRQAENQKQALALMHQANEFLVKLKELAPPAFGLAVCAASGAPVDELIQRLAPFELESVNSKLANDPNNLAQLTLRAHLLKIIGKQKEQLADLDRILSLQPNNTWALSERVDAFANLGRFVEAQEALEVESKIHHDFHNIDQQAYYNQFKRQAYISIGLSEYRRALAIYKLIDSQGYGSPEVFCGMAAAKRALGDDEEAWKDIGRARKIDPTYCLHWAGPRDPGHHEEPCSKPTRRLSCY